MQQPPCSEADRDQEQHIHAEIVYHVAARSSEEPLAVPTERLFPKGAPGTVPPQVRYIFGPSGTHLKDLLRRYLAPPGTHLKDLLRRYDWSRRVCHTLSFLTYDLLYSSVGVAQVWQWIFAGLKAPCSLFGFRHVQTPDLQYGHRSYRHPQF